MSENSNADNSDPLAGALAALEAEAAAEETTETTATDETTEQVATEEVTETTEETTEAEDDHSEKSRLGRKVKRQEETLTALTSKIDSLADLITKNLTPKQEAALEEEFELSEYPSGEELMAFKKFTIEQAKKAAKSVLADERAEATTKAQQYEGTYLKLMADMTTAEDDDDTVSGEIKTLLVSEDKRFNAKHTGDATKDFLINYRNATDFLLRRGKEKVPNVHGKQSKVATGVNVPRTAQRVATFDRSKLDPIEQGLAAAFTDKELAEMGA